jgi:hypothetical protein
LTNQFLAEQQRPARPRPHEDAGAAFLDEVSLDEQMALELARAATDDTYALHQATLCHTRHVRVLTYKDDVIIRMLGFGMTYRDNTFNCPYPGCASKLEAQELPAHAATKHSACIQTLSCPICERETVLPLLPFAPPHHRTTAPSHYPPPTTHLLPLAVAHRASPTHPTKTRTFSSTWATRMATCTWARSLFHIVGPHRQHSPRAVRGDEQS